MGKRINFSIILIIFIGIIIYSTSLPNQFVWDDEFLIEKNFLIKDWHYIKQIFTTHLFYGSNHPSNFYRPMQALTLLMDYSTWRLNPAGYHIMNVTLHVITALLLYFLIKQLNAVNDKIVLISSLLFLVHPINTEAVTYISGRADPLSTMFMLISLLLFARFNVTHRKIIYASSLICFTLGLLSKETMIVSPLIFLAYSLLFLKTNKEKSFTLLAPFFLITAIYLVLRLSIFNFGYYSSFFDESLNQANRFLLAGKVLVKYLGIYILPLHLHMERSASIPKSIFDPAVLLSILILFALVMFFKKLLNTKAAFFGVIWFIIYFIPISNIFPLNARMAEHWLYQPSIGLVILIAVGLEKLARLFTTRLITVSCSCIISLYAIFTFNQNIQWKDALTLYQRTLKYNPESPRAHFNLGNIYKKDGRFYQAMNEYKTAIKLRSNYDEAYNNLGNIYFMLERVDEAIACYDKAVLISPKLFETYNNLGNAYLKKEDYANAIENYKKALPLMQNNPNIHYNLSLAYSNNGQIKEAIYELETLLKLNPSDIEASRILKELKMIIKQ